MRREEGFEEERRKEDWRGLCERLRDEIAKDAIVKGWNLEERFDFGWMNGWMVVWEGKVKRWGNGRRTRERVSLSN